MALKARVLYDFHSENPGEISISENEVVTLYSEKELDGWLEGENSRGEAGLLPASYVEIIRDHLSSSSNNNGLSVSKPTPHSYTSSDALEGLPTSQGSDDDWDDEWDDSSPATNAPRGLGGVPPLYPVTSSLPGRRDGNQQQQQHQAKSSATVGRNLNRFSTFVKSGGEAFLLGEASAFVRDGDRICVALGKHGPEWQENPYPFTCTIDDPTKQTKFKGMKSYMSYGLTPTHTNVQVNRRYGAPPIAPNCPVCLPSAPKRHQQAAVTFCPQLCSRFSLVSRYFLSPDGAASPVIFRPLSNLCRPLCLTAPPPQVQALRLALRPPGGALPGHLRAPPARKAGHRPL